MCPPINALPLSDPLFLCHNTCLRQQLSSDQVITTNIINHFKLIKYNPATNIHVQNRISYVWTITAFVQTSALAEGSSLDNHKPT
jgi:hypothetical protein